MLKSARFFVVWGNLCKFGLDFSAVRFRRVSDTLTTIFKMAEKENIGYIAQVNGPVVRRLSFRVFTTLLMSKEAREKGLWSLRFSNISVKTL